MNRKLFTNAAAFVLLTVGAVGSGYALSDTEACNDKLLSGHYGFTSKALNLLSRTSPDPPAPR